MHFVRVPYGSKCALTLFSSESKDKPYTNNSNLPKFGSFGSPLDSSTAALALGISFFVYTFFYELLDEPLLDPSESSLELSDAAATFLTEDLSESPELEESSDEDAGFFAGAFLFSTFLFFTKSTDESLLSESEETDTFFFFEGKAAFSIVFLTFLLLLSLFPLTFDDPLGLLPRISFLDGFSEELLELEEELLTCFLAGFYYTFLSSFLTAFFCTTSDDEEESESEDEDSTFFVAFFF